MIGIAYVGVVLYLAMAGLFSQATEKPKKVDPPAQVASAPEKDRG